MKKKAYDISYITKERILHELGCIAFACGLDYIDLNSGDENIKSHLTSEKAAAVSEIVQTKDGIRLKFYDKLKALDMISKQMGFYLPDEADEANHGVVILSEIDGIDDIN